MPRASPVTKEETAFSSYMKKRREATDVPEGRLMRRVTRSSSQTVVATLCLINPVPVRLPTNKMVSTEFRSTAVGESRSAD